MAASVRASVTLQWTNNDTPADETGFIIERSAGGATFVQIATVAPTTTTFRDTTINSAVANSYRVCAYNAAGPSAYTNVVSIAAAAPAPPPTVPTATGSASFVVQPSSRTVAAGSTVVFSAQIVGNGATNYQWQCNGTPIAGATDPYLVLMDAAAQNCAGSYTCVATSAAGTFLSAAATLSFASTTDVGRLINLSVLNAVSARQVLTLGFTSGGAGTTGSEPVLIRAVGPSLAGFGISEGLADPTLSVFTGSNLLESNQGWAALAANQAAVTTADAQVGAFALTNPQSLDAALVALLPSHSADTVQVGGSGPSSGKVLAEVYDDTPAGTDAPALPRLMNLSSLAAVPADGALTAGFVVGGATATTVLIRATGPALAPLGVAGPMADPQLQLHAVVNGQDTVLAANAAWGGDPQITVVSNAVGAFPLTNLSSHDSVVLATLAPGAYTAVVSSSSGAGGAVLIEVYQVP